MADTTEAAVSAAQNGSETLTILRHIEELLQTQTEQNKKILRSSRWRTVLMFIFVAAFVIVGIAFYGVLQNITRDIPQVISEVEDLISNADGAVKDIVGKVDELNIDALNESIEGIASINYKGLNTSIGGLAKSVESFQAFVDALSTPAQTIGGLFGGGGRN